MALWKGQTETDSPSPSAVRPPPIFKPPETSTMANVERPAPTATTTTAAPAPRANAESVVASGLVIEGKIQGNGHVRIAGNFNGDIQVDGNLTIDPGAKVTGGVTAKRVTIAGELQGNIDAASAVELAATGVLNGDLKAGSLTVAAGSRMRGKVEFGWDEKEQRSTTSMSSASVSRGGFGSSP
jgi:cytoskeletal protein CcmA (bactofilin family)